jgi:hypothetical protein
MKVFPYCNTDLKCQYLPATNYDSCKCVDLERDLICFFSRSTALSALSNITTCFQVHKFLITYERTIFAEARVVFFVNDKVRTLPPPALVYFSLLRRVVGFRQNIAFTTIPPQANDGHPVKRMHRPPQDTCFHAHFFHFVSVCCARRFQQTASVGHGQLLHTTQCCQIQTWVTH